MVVSDSKKVKGKGEVDRYYGVWTDAGATKNLVWVQPGEAKYMTNFVYEDGFVYAALGFITRTGGTDYYLAWSPDSI